MGRERRTSLLRGLFGWVLGVVVLLSSATPASAHARLEESSPEAGSVLTTAPRTITLTFGESVEPSSSTISLYDDHFRRIETGPVLQVGSDGTRLQVPLPQTLGRGTFTVEYRVSSSDTHVVSGTFTFSVGAPSTVSGTAPSGQNDLAGKLVGGARFLGFVGLALGPGLLLVLGLLWRDGLAVPAARRLLWTGLGLLVASTVVQRVLQGVWASGVPIASVWTSPASLDTHSRRFDQLMALRFYLVVGFAGVLGTTLARTRSAPAGRGAGDVRSSKPAPRPRRPARGSAAKAVEAPPPAGPALVAVAGALAIGLVVTWALAGHAASDGLVVLSATANAVHLLALSVWLGGLALLAVCLTPRARPEGLDTFLVRFSALALTCVGIIAVTGLVLTWREAWPPEALVHTAYGRLLLAKLALVTVLVALGALARRWVARHRRAAGVTLGTGHGVHDVALLRRGVAAEVASGALVLALSSALVVMVPADQAYVPPSRAAVVVGPLHLEVEIPEPRPGDVVVTVTVRAGDGSAEPVRAMSGTATSAGGTRVPLRPDASGGASSEGRTSFSAHLPATGGVTIRLSVTTSAGTWVALADLRLS
ncbi:copper resistance CopC/CopD family protein [Terrabacter sp. BE26]|uniref:copper resistance CopC/CopD family protein n=1 Tax=Terrabacter sp. BE26 TaxID=2898152 RepID=UPI0035BE3148